MAVPKVVRQLPHTIRSLSGCNPCMPRFVALARTRTTLVSMFPQPGHFASVIISLLSEKTVRTLKVRQGGAFTKEAYR